VWGNKSRERITGIEEIEKPLKKGKSFKKKTVRGTEQNRGKKGTPPEFAPQKSQRKGTWKKKKRRSRIYEPGD